MSEAKLSIRAALTALAIAFASACTLLGPGALRAQDAERPDRVTLEGEVVDVSNNVPVEAAIVGFPGLGVTAVTDRLGYYRMDDVPTGIHAVRVIRLGYQEFEAYVPINDMEVLALYLTPGPIPLEGIEVKVVGLDDLDWRPIGTSKRTFIGPGEIEDLRGRYLSLHHVLTVRRLPRARYNPPPRPGEPGCLRLTLSVASRPYGPCAMVVVDGAPLDPEYAGLIYETSTHDIYSLRFLYGSEATLRYGHRGAGGVLLVTTHQGR